MKKDGFRDGGGIEILMLRTQEEIIVLRIHLSGSIFNYRTLLFWLSKKSAYKPAPLKPHVLKPPY